MHLSLFCSSDNFKSVQSISSNKGGSGNSNSSSSSSSSNSNNKPPPHERVLQRSRTVAGGMGAAKQSKKAMLLKWCQYVTQDYEVCVVGCGLWVWFGRCMDM